MHNSVSKTTKTLNKMLILLNTIHFNFMFLYLNLGIVQII